MKIVEPQVELWKQEPTLEGAWNQIARATRVCYQSKPREGESSEDFVKRVILKPALIEGSLDDLEHCKFNFDKMHGGMLEHGTVYLSFDVDNNLSIVKTLKENKYTKVFEHFASAESVVAEITTNVRVLIENNIINLLNYICKPTKYHTRRYTFSVITDIGVTRELNRHRVNSIAEQSTRYCTYSADKFGNEITYISNSPFLECVADDKYYFRELCEDITDNSYKSIWDDRQYYAFGLLAAEFAYLGLKKNKVPNDMARQVLNLNTRSQAVYTAFDDDWEHFIKLRADNVSGKVHPNIQLVAKKIKDIYKTL